MNKKFILLIIGLIFIGIVSTFIYKSQGLKRSYKQNVLDAVKKVSPMESDILTGEDISALPEPVKKYIIYTGAVGKEKIKNMRIAFEGNFRGSPKDAWMKFKSEQYNFFENQTRQYYMVAKKAGVPAMGLHSYINGKASMLIKLLGLFTISYEKGEVMNTSETVTAFNDMCCMAPATLIDKRIKWETIDPLTVKGIFTNNGILVSALLYFNEKGQLINFISEDRYQTGGKNGSQRIKWSTPLKDYRDFDGRKLPTYADAIWHMPEGPFTYGEFTLKEVEYNITSYK